jgi:hypothetical protein
LWVASQSFTAVAASSAGLDRARLGDAGLLAEAGQGVIFAEERDDRTAVAPFAHQRRRNSGDILGDAKTLVAELGQMFGGRTRLGVADLGHAPDPVGQRRETRLDRVDAAPDITAIVHGPVRCWERRSGKVISFAKSRLGYWICRHCSHVTKGTPSASRRWL